MKKRKEIAASRKDYLARNPFARELYRKTRRKWRELHKDEINRKRRERYASDPEYRERVLHAPTKNGPDRKTTRAKAYKILMQDPAARAKKKARDRRYRQSDACKEARKRYKAKIKTDPVRLENMRVSKRLSRLRNADKAYLKHVTKDLVPKWSSIASEGSHAVLAYWKRIGVKTRSYMMKWLRTNGYPVPEITYGHYETAPRECLTETWSPN